MANRRGLKAWQGLGLLAGLVLVMHGGAAAAAEEQMVNPLRGDATAIAEGRHIYRTRCVICHGRSGARGPNIFATKLDDETFLETVINGRRTMPALGALMSVDDVWAVHAYVVSTDRYQ